MPSLLRRDTDKNAEEKGNEGVWSLSQMTYLYFSGDKPVLGEACHVRITPSWIEISYYTEDRPSSSFNNMASVPPLQYVARNRGDGHFRLSNGGLGHSESTAELHQCELSKTLVGSWNEEGKQIGLWKIVLAEGFGR